MLGRYRLLSLLATGGMGEVFLARQEGPGGFAKTVVVKRILRHLAQDQGFIDQFLNEAKLAALLQHPHIAQVFGLEHEADTWFMAMEYVHGRSLRAIIDECKRKGLKVPVRLGVRLCSQVLQGLHSAHELRDEQGAPLGILHRDVTPENILVSFSGLAKLVDFGIAKAMSNATLRSRPPWGKLPYMAPELIRQKPPADRRADLYGLAVVMYELLTLARPPNVQLSMETLNVPQTPYEPKGELPPGLDVIAAKALALTPEERFETAGDMSQALEAWLTSTAQTVVPDDVRGFLVDLFGQSAVERHDSGARPVHAGTQPLMLGTAPLVRASAEMSMPSAEQSLSTKAQTRVVVALGVLTTLVFVVVTVVGIFGSTDGTPVQKVNALPDVPVEPVAAVRPADPDDGKTPPPVVDTDVDGGANDDDDGPDPKPPGQKKHPPRFGKVVFKVNPGVEVFLGNRSLGVTPLKGPITLPVGPVTFTLKNQKTGLAKKVSSRVVGGTAVTLKAEVLKK